MRSFFFLALALCFVASVNAQATVYTLNYPTADCSGPSTSNTTYTYNLGQVYNQTFTPGQYLGLTQAVFADVSGNFFITVYYTDQTAATAYSISQAFYSGWFGNLNQCTFTGTGSKKTTVVNPGAGPVAPSGGSNWVQVTQSWNVTTNPFTQITTCPQVTSGVGVTILSSWSAPNVCVLAGQNYGQESQAVYATGNGLFVGTAKFGSTNCAASSLLSAVLSAVGQCKNGQVSQSSGSASVFPSSLPNQGRVSYSTASTDCSNSDSLATVSLQAGVAPTATVPTVCVDRTTFYCTTNSTTGLSQVTYQQWSDVGCTVPNQGSGPQTYVAASASQGNTLTTALNLNSVCITQGNSHFAYSCQLFTGAASSVSFSVFALLVAAVASLIASKSL